MVWLPATETKKDDGSATAVEIDSQERSTRSLLVTVCVAAVGLSKSDKECAGVGCCWKKVEKKERQSRIVWFLERAMRCHTMRLLCLIFPINFTVHSPSGQEASTGEGEEEGRSERERKKKVGGWSNGQSRCLSDRERWKKERAAWESAGERLSGWSV
jgi:hypothetical protein